MKKFSLLLLLITLLNTGCGFSVVQQTKLNKFDINKIITSGNKRINYKIKNKILFRAQSNEQALINVEINTKKIKSIKEKNIKNVVTKYQIIIITEVKLSKINQKNFSSFTISKSGDYTAEKQFAQTLNKENKLTELLTNKLISEILRELTTQINDL